MTVDLRELEETARRHGWATASGSMEEVRAAAAILGWKETPTRIGESAVANLRPMTQQEAPSRSLSATYGLGAQPLHTDGAHLAIPPDRVVLWAQEPNETPTLLWTMPPDSNEHAASRAWLDHGVFLVDNGRDSFFTSAATSGGFRFDPGCMVACDQRSRRLAMFFEEALVEAHSHHWETPEQVLLINNRTTLHARAALSDQDRSRSLVRIAFNTRQSQ
jgi:alpha-ketoglutarate-dependent taurine dioxygenase